MNYKNHVIEKLKNYSKKDIIIKNHAIDQAIFRGIDLDEVKANILILRD